MKTEAMLKIVSKNTMELFLKRKSLSKKNPQKLLQPNFWAYLYCNEFYKIACDTGFESNLALQVVDEAFYLAKMSQEEYSGNITEKAWLLGFLYSQIEKFNMSMGNQNKEIENQQLNTEIRIPSKSISNI